MSTDAIDLLKLSDTCQKDQNDDEKVIINKIKKENTRKNLRLSWMRSNCDKRSVLDNAVGPSRGGTIRS